jgi:hypothetical protein
MARSLKKQLHSLIRDVLDSYPGAWMVWCDPQGYWSPLLDRTASDTRMGLFPIIAVSDTTAGEIGSPRTRAELQAHLDAGESFVLLVPTGPDNLGWLWAQALLAEQVYDKPLPQQLREWGWRPPTVFTSDQEVAALARQNIHQDPAEWGGSSLQPDVDMLLQALAGSTSIDPDQRLVLDLTVEQAGLAQAPSDDEEQSWQRWRLASLARLLVAQAQSASPKIVSAQQEMLIAPDKRGFALSMLDRWLDSASLSKRLPEIIQRADTLTGLADLMEDGTLKQGPFISYTAERALFSACCARLAEKSNKELLVGTTPQGRTMPWCELLRLSRAARQLLDASPLKTWSSPKEAVAWYTETGWQVEQAGEEILKDLAVPAMEMLNVITPLRTAYKARWEEYMRQWSDVWVASGCPVPDLPTAGEWLSGSLKDGLPTAVIVIDALRYDLGAALAQSVNIIEEAERASVSAARAPLPSITALGMAMNMPIPESDLQAVVDAGGKWHISAQGSTEDLSNAAQRRQWWQRKGGVPENGILSIQDVLTGSITSSSECSRLVIYDDALDKLGHDDELQAQGSRIVLERYLTAIERLRDSGYKRILIVTDHGYIHWDGKEERSVPVPMPNPAYASRRAAAYKADQQVDGPSGLAPGGGWRIAVPRGAAAFRTYGGHGYYHGGASLQEWVIPCVRVEWPSKARQVDIGIVPLPQILGQRPRVELTVVRDSFLIEDSIPRQVEVVIRKVEDRVLLFRSGPVRITPAQADVDVILQYVEGVEAGRGSHLRIEVRDLSTEAVIASADSVLMIELTGW